MAAGAMGASRRRRLPAGSSPILSPTTGRIRSTRPSPSSASPPAIQSTRRAPARRPARIEMLLIPCPFCGPRDHVEFSYGGDATLTRPDPSAPDAAWIDYIYLRDNPKGPHLEYWQHHAGCRAWLTVRRHP